MVMYASNKKLQNLYRLFIILPILIIIYSCAASEMQVSEFEFNYNNENYLIRSAYCPNNPQSCNQLIGNGFIAVDMNQDRIIDNISKGDISLSQAQEIYDYCLTLLAREGKLNEIDRSTNKFTLRDIDFNYELSSFKPLTGSPFNEFAITDKGNKTNFQQIVILIDNDADGILDELVKGVLPLKEAQAHYDLVIEKGLNQGKIRKENGYMIVE